MKKIKIVIVSGLLLCATSVYAQSMYADLGIGVLDTNKIDNQGVGPMARFGYLFSDPSNSLGIEVEANPMTVKTEDNNGNNHNDRDMAIVLGTYLVYSYQVGDSQFSLRPRIGVVFPNLGDNLYKDSGSFAYGLSALYKFNDDLSGYISYGSFGSSVNHVSVGISIGF
ncbi:MAG: hypothetical protein COA44_14120 [Arcobacter sp.]|nr:MAG: hypothetical protein COA44_14120 [Arcobacter sp.]